LLDKIDEGVTFGHIFYRGVEVLYWVLVGFDVGSKGGNFLLGSGFLIASNEAP